MGSVTDIKKFEKEREANKPEQQVYSCSVKLYKDQDTLCEAQGHVLKDDGVVICSGCMLESPFVWSRPPTSTLSQSLQKRVLRRKESRTLPGIMIHVCWNCSHLHFHFYERGTIHCMRCKKQQAERFEIAEGGVVA